MLFRSIFTPNKVYNVIHYDDYSKYNGAYFLSYKREFYRITTGDEFLVTCNVGLKLCGTEELARATSDTTAKVKPGSKNATTTSSSSKKKTSSKKTTSARKTSSSSKTTTSARSIRSVTK